jgi:hypothetical protein
MRYNRAAIILVFIASLSHAQDGTPSEREMIQQLVQQVTVLQEKVKVLESQQQRANAPSTADATPQPASVTTPQAEDHNAQPASLPHEPHELHGIQWRGFGEVDYKVLNQRKPELGTYGFVPGSHGNFYTGDFDLLLTSRITDKASVLAEIVFAEEPAQKFGVDLERVLFKYDYNDHLRMSFGRYHTAIGYYNTAFHSGSWLQTSADRPLIMEFANEGGCCQRTAYLVHDQLAQSLSFARAGAPDVLGFLRNRVRVRRCSGRTSRPEIPILVVLAHHRAGPRHVLLRDAI